MFRRRPGLQAKSFDPSGVPCPEVSSCQLYIHQSLGRACETRVAGAKGSDAAGLGWGLRMHISKKGPQAAAAGGPQTTLGEALL